MTGEEAVAAIALEHLDKVLREVERYKQILERNRELLKELACVRAKSEDRR